ncbi:MAG: type II toxin-antitoxin system prevent-host-death family antitoxin [Rhodopila sp.]|nr:type II toxin-antitoxin system prevent-host-death family antitoxin [Rhodopila sp.]
MPVFNMLEAKTNLSRLVEAVETGAEAEIVIARNGRPVARLVAIKPAKTGKRIGVARGKFTVPETIDADEAAITALFAGSNA